MQRFEILPHTADVAVAIYGRSLPELFENAGAALFELMFDMDVGPSGRSARIEARGSGTEELLVAWLSELLLICEVEGVALSGFEVALEGAERVTGTALVVSTDGLILSGAPIKAVTYHDLEVRQAGGLWRATVVFDV